MKRKIPFQPRTPRGNWLVLLAATVILLPGAANAPSAKAQDKNADDRLGSGMPFTLPEDGSWARFEYEHTGGRLDGSNKLGGKGTLTIRSVGRVRENGESCRWLEWEQHSQEQNSIQTDQGERARERELNSVFKLLIAEKHLDGSHVPLEHVIRGWGKWGDNDPVAIDSQSPRFPQRMRAILHGPLENVVSIGTKDFVIRSEKAGNLKCTGLKGTEKLSFRSGEQIITCEEWLNENVPFGRVMGRTKAEWTREDGRGGALTASVKLVDFGTDAVSKLPDKD